MKLVFLVFFLNLLSWTAHASFVRIFENTLQIAWGHYSNGHHEVELLGTSHFGDEKYYSHVQEIARGKIVIYELAGCNYEQKIRQQDALERLPIHYQRLFRDIRLLQSPSELAALAFGLTFQNNSNFLSQAHELIHADIVAPQKYLDAYAKNEDLMRLIDEVSLSVLRYFNKKAEDPTVTLGELIDMRIKKLPELSKYIKNGLSYEKQLADDPIREGIIFARLQELFSRSLLAQRILVSYGAAHLERVAAFLCSRGFRLIKTEWITVLSF